MCWGSVEDKTHTSSIQHVTSCEVQMVLDLLGSMQESPRGFHRLLESGSSPWAFASPGLVGQGWVEGAASLGI